MSLILIGRAHARVKHVFGDQPTRQKCAPKNKCGAVFV